jgi:hypothetical protein
MNNLDGLVESADAAGVQLDRLSAAFAVGYNMGLRVRDCWNAPCVRCVCNQTRPT